LYTKTNYIVSNNDDSPVTWQSTLNLVQIIILIALFLDSFSNILRFLPLLSGSPTRKENISLSKIINNNNIIEGRAVLGNINILFF
jgi:hypothetical protein